MIVNSIINERYQSYTILHNKREHTLLQMSRPDSVDVRGYEAQMLYSIPLSI